MALDVRGKLRSEFVTFSILQHKISMCGALLVGDRGAFRYDTTRVISALHDEGFGRQKILEFLGIVFACDGSLKRADVEIRILEFVRHARRVCSRAFASTGDDNRQKEDFFDPTVKGSSQFHTSEYY